MKKLLLSIGLLASTFMNAQENWVNIESGGFAQGATFMVNHVFQNRIYVAGDTSFGPNPGSVLYSSPTGDYGSFVEEMGIKPILQNGTLASAASNSTALFFGSEVKYDTTGGVTGNTPQVYKFDGSTYTQHGTIDYSLLPPDNEMVSGNTPAISVMALYSPTGSNDTIYAFEKTHYGAIKNLSVFKAPANVTNPTWINSTNFPSASGITSIYDAQVWHNKLYIAVCNGTNGGMILRTANGVDWDTVTTALSMSTVLGVNSFNDYFTSLEIFRDTLVASVINSYNASLVYTADSLTVGQTWNALIDSAGSSIMTNNVLDNIVDMTVGDGKLWILGSANFSSGPRGFVVTKNANNKDTLLTSTNSTGLESGMNYSDDYRMSYLNNAVYAVGHSYGGARAGNPNGRKSGGSGSAGTGMNAGNIYRFKTVNPVASFVDSVNAGYGYCAFNTVYLASTSSDAATAEWYVDGSQFNSGLNVTFNPNGAGTYTITMIAYNGTNQSLYSDTATTIITIYDNPHIDTVSASTYTVCQGQSDSLFTKVSGGTAPYTYTWYNVADGITYPGDSVTIIQLYVVPSPSPYVYNYVTVKDANMCYGSGPFTNLNIYVNASDSLSGIVNDTLLNPVTAGKVYLFKLNPLDPNPGDTAGVYTLAANGYYTFPSLFYGSYIAKAIADTANPLYATSVGTYYSNKTYAFQWDSALVIQHHGCTAGNQGGNDIKILQIPNAPSGPGTITGQVTESNSYGMRYSGPNSISGAPLKGVDIKLGRNPGGSPAARTTTDNSGNYSFTNIPIGNYKIYVDIPNFGMDSVRTVDLTVNDTSVHNDYYVDSAMVRVVPVDSVNKAICIGDSIMLGGSYQLTAGIYTDVLQTLWGYDSVIVTTLTITPLPTLTVVANSYTVCSGSQVDLTATGATSYVWSSNAGSLTTSTVSINPTANDTYTVTGTASGCSSDQTVSVNILPLPNVTASASTDSICSGGSITLTGGGATSYTWSSGVADGTPFIPTGSANYTVTGTDANNCVNTDTVSVIVKTCIGIKQISAVGLLNVYPIPATNSLFIDLEKSAKIKIYNITGVLVMEQSVIAGKNEINISNLAAGAYDLMLSAEGKTTYVKVMVSK